MSDIDLTSIYINLNEFIIDTSEFKKLEEPIEWQTTHASIAEHLSNIEEMMEEKLRGE